MDAGRDAVRLAALRALLRLLCEPAPVEAIETDPALTALILEGADERAMCAALGLSRDEVRAQLIRLAR